MVAGSGTVFAATGLLLLVSVALAARISIAGEPSPEASVPRSETLLAGWRAIVSEPGLRVVIGLSTAQTLVAGLVQVLVVVMAIELLSLGTAGVGWLNGMRRRCDARSSRCRRSRWAQVDLAVLRSRALALWGVPLILIAAWPETAAAFLLLALLGVGNTLVDVTGITLIQRTASDAVLGRVFGAFEALALLAMGIGALLAPVLVSSLGSRGAVLVAGLIMPVTLLPFWRRLARSTQRPRCRPSWSSSCVASRSSPRYPHPSSNDSPSLVDVRIEPGSAVFEEGDPATAST